MDSALAEKHDSLTGVIKSASSLADSDSVLQSYIDDLVAAVKSQGAEEDVLEPKYPRSAHHHAAPSRKSSHENLTEREALFIKRLQIAQSRSRFIRSAKSRNHQLDCDVFTLGGQFLAIPSDAIDRVSRIGRVSAAVISTAHKVAKFSAPLAQSAWAKKYRELRSILSEQHSKPECAHEEGDAGPLNPDDALNMAEHGKSGLSVRLKGSQRFIFVEAQVESMSFDPAALEFAEFELDEWSTELNGGLVGAAVDQQANLVYLFDPLQLDRISDARHVLRGE